MDYRRSRFFVLYCNGKKNHNISVKTFSLISTKIVPTRLESKWTIVRSVWERIGIATQILTEIIALKVVGSVECVTWAFLWQLV